MGTHRRFEQPKQSSIGLAPRGFVPHSLEQPVPVEPKGRERDRDDATLGLPTACPSLEVTPRGVYGATAAASGLESPGPPRTFRPALCVAGNLIQKKSNSPELLVVVS